MVADLEAPVLLAVSATGNEGTLAPGDSFTIQIVASDSQSGIDDINFHWTNRNSTLGNGGQFFGDDDFNAIPRRQNINEAIQFTVPEFQ